KMLQFLTENWGIILYKLPAQNGGGIYIDNTDAVVTISDSTISENTAQNGGGIYLNNGALTISSTTMESNTATAESTEGDAGVGGGAIYSRKSITFTDCTFLGNDSLKGKAIRFKPMDSEQKLKFNGKIQTNEDDIYFDNGRRFVIQTPLSPDSSILVTPYPCTTGQTILDVEEGVTLAEQVDYFKVTPQVNGSYENQYVVNFNGKILLFQEIEQLTNKPQDNTLVSISTAEGFDKVITWLNTNNLTYITLLLENDLSLAIQIPSNFAGTINGKGHTITGTNQEYKTLFASSSANFINLNVSGSYTAVKPET
ncbi:right-handed parallel beta-helix repeat-containing protein, partial [Treponema berlinense]|uniref:right-handed parallel beta-helix repeat-containing protein n=1 Tax=Treponema berlinense TaxID=225004 RepID=UPI0034E98BE4